MTCSIAADSAAGNCAPRGGPAGKDGTRSSRHRWRAEVAGGYS